MTGSRLDCARRELIPPDMSNDNLPRSWSRLPTSSLQWGETTKSSSGNNLDVTFPCLIRSVSATTQPILDLHEVMPDWETDPERARAYVWSVIDVIWATAPALLPRLR